MPKHLHREEYVILALQISTIETESRVESGLIRRDHDQERQHESLFEFRSRTPFSLAGVYLENSH